MRSAALLALVLLLPALAGCFGGEEGQGEDIVRQRAEVTDSTGGIEGSVTDAAIQPVVGANVTLVELGLSTATVEDGSYAFSTLEPGTYTLEIRAEGFISTSREVTVNTGEATVVDVIIEQGQSQQPFTQTLEMKGFVECGLGWRQEAAEVVSPLIYDSALAVCAVPNIATDELGTGSNATNDKFLHRFELEAPIHTAIYELEWISGGPSATSAPLRTIMEIQGQINQNGARIFDVRGTNPILVEVGPDDWSSLVTNVTDRCQGLNDTTQDDSWCGYNLRDGPWPLVLRIFATGDCLEQSPAATCPVIQQEFTHYVSAFYNQPAPDGYRITQPG